MDSVKAFIKFRREFASTHEQVLLHEYDRLCKAHPKFTSGLPPLVVSVLPLRSSTRFRVELDSRGFAEVQVNERLYRINHTDVVMAAFRHVLIHLHQLHGGVPASHTRAFKVWARALEALDDKKLRTPVPKVQRLTYVCPSGCQELRTVDSVVLVCGHCGNKMRALGQAGYKKYKALQRQEAKRVLRELKGGGEGADAD